MNDIAMWALFSNSDSGEGERILGPLSQGGRAIEGELQMLEHVTYSTLKMGGMCKYSLILKEILMRTEITIAGAALNLTFIVQIFGKFVSLSHKQE